jgi:hypothetical protein
VSRRSGEQAVPGREGTTRGGVPPRLPLPARVHLPVGPRKELKFGYRPQLDRRRIRNLPRAAPDVV